MENRSQKICLEVVKHTIILENIILLADYLGVQASERRNLTLEIRKGGVDYYDCIKTLLEGWVSRGEKRTVQDLLKILEELEYGEITEILRNEFSPEATFLKATAKSLPGTKQPKRMWNVLNPVTNFVGREEEISKLEAFLDDLEQRILVISGIGGQGKTQLCRKLIKGLKTLDNCPAIIWLAGESSQALSSSLIDFIKKFGQSSDESVIKTFENSMNHAITLIEDEEKVVWVADNVDTDYPELETMAQIILAKAENSKIIITSRLRTLLTDDAEYLTVESLSPEAAHKLIKIGINESLEDGGIETLCEEMGYHALALRLSIGFIKSQRNRAGGKGFGIKDFLLVFNNDKKLLFEKTEKLTLYEKNIYHHVSQFMKVLKERQEYAAEELLLLLSLFRHDGVGSDFLQEIIVLDSSLWGQQFYGMESNAPDQIKKALDQLHSLSLIDAASLSAITIHPLIQETTRFFFYDWIEVSNSILRLTKVENLSKHNLSHILRVWEIGSKEDTLLRNNIFQGIDIFWGLYNTSQIQALIPFTDSYKKSVHRVCVNFGNNPPTEKEMAKAELCNARAYMYNGKYEEGSNILTSLYQSASRFFGESDPLTLMIEVEMVNALIKLERSGEAVTLYQAMLPRHISALGENHHEVMKLKKSYAIALTKCNKRTEAHEQYEDVLQWETQNSGSTLPNTIALMHNIACSHYEEGKLEQAMSELQAVLELQRRASGEKHVQTVKIRGSIFIVLCRMGEYERAKIAYETLSEDAREVLGITHSTTLDYKWEYTFCLLKLRKFADSRNEMEELLGLQIHALGQHHPLVEKTREVLLQFDKVKANQTAEKSPTEES